MNHRCLAGLLLLALPLLAQADEQFSVHGSSVGCADILALNQAVIAQDAGYFAGWTQDDFRNAIDWSNACPGSDIEEARHPQIALPARDQFLAQLQTRFAAYEKANGNSPDLGAIQSQGLLAGDSTASVAATESPRPASPASASAMPQSHVLTVHGQAVTCANQDDLNRALWSSNLDYFKGWQADDFDAASIWIAACGGGKLPYGGTCEQELRIREDNTLINLGSAQPGEEVHGYAASALGQSNRGTMILRCATTLKAMAVLPTDRVLHGLERGQLSSVQADFYRHTAYNCARHGFITADEAATVAQRLATSQAQARKKAEEAQARQRAEEAQARQEAEEARARQKAAAIELASEPAPTVANGGAHGHPHKKPQHAAHQSKGNTNPGQPHLALDSAPAAQDNGQPHLVLDSAAKSSANTGTSTGGPHMTIQGVHPVGAGQ